MRTISTNQDVPHSSAEICLNLWYYVDDSGIVIRLAGKAYALTGSDQEKLAILHQLSGTDHLTATAGKVPPKFNLSSDDGVLVGAIPVHAIHQSQGDVFGLLMDEIERNLPAGVRDVGGDYQSFKLKLPQGPLCVTTAVYERPDGELIARVGNNS